MTLLIGLEDMEDKKMIWMTPDGESALELQLETTCLSSVMTWCRRAGDNVGICHAAVVLRIHSKDI